MLYALLLLVRDSIPHLLHPPPFSVCLSFLLTSPPLPLIAQRLLPIEVHLTGACVCVCVCVFMFELSLYDCHDLVGAHLGFSVE